MMMIRLLACALVALSVSVAGSLAVDEDTDKKVPPLPEKKDTKDEEKPASKQSAPVIKLAPQSLKNPVSSLALTLLPAASEQVEGNAPTFWYRATLSMRNVRFKWEDKHYSWGGPRGVALKDLPLKEMKEILDKHTGALKMAEAAALRKSCDWGMPKPTIQNLSEYQYDSIQNFREMAWILSLQFRYQLAQKKFEDALRTLQIGFAMAQHLSRGSLIIEDLVAIAISSIMLGHVEEWIETPDTPNLYWALTQLPQPLIDVRPGIRTELDTVYRSFPMLIELKKQKLSKEEASTLVEKLFQALAQNPESSPPGMTALGQKLIIEKHYPTAKKALLAAGRPEKQVEALPKIQAVAIYYLEQYDKSRDAILELLLVPTWQTTEKMQKLDNQFRAKAKEDGNFPLTTLFPAIYKVHHAQCRADRIVVGLRAAEGLRQYAHENKGAVMAKWSDLPRPDPIDPITGKSTGEWYKVSEGVGVLDVPSLMPAVPILGRRIMLHSSK
jgi:hypothetical protein